MPGTDRESRVVQKQKLHMLLCIENDIKEQGAKSPMLDHFKKQLFSEMDSEDFAFVQKSFDAEHK